MADEELVRILKEEGVKAWNRLASEKRRKDLLWRADLREVDFREADLRGARLEFSRLHKANFAQSDLRGANLAGASLFGAVLIHADLQEAILAASQLRDASLQGANLGEAVLDNADLRDSDLRQVQNLQLDSCRIQGALFDFRAKDPWNRLRIRYTGAAFIFNLLLLALFIAPYLLQTAMWVGVNQSQEFIEQASWALQDAARAIEATDPLGAERLKATALRLSNLKRCLAKNCEERPIWHLILGLDKGWGYVTLVALLLTYNVGRAFLTRQVAPLREAEERSSTTPAKTDYWRLHLIDKWAVTPLAYGAIAAGLINAYIWLVLETVWIPV